MNYLALSALTFKCRSIFSLSGKLSVTVIKPFVNLQIVSIRDWRGTKIPADTAAAVIWIKLLLQSVKNKSARMSIASILRRLVQLFIQFYDGHLVIMLSGMYGMIIIVSRIAANHYWIYSWTITLALYIQYKYDSELAMATAWLLC